ncbi:hypothetical protein [Thioclava kandeliae]|uniref:HEPN AbiU2-like domain-containing protein n=1 Tax=Thioclava kandeliae TaxID=3070818 RepID=A0ABV1SKH4_9RHOB
MDHEPRATFSEILRNDVAQLHIRFRIYDQWFGVDPRRVEILNETSGSTAKVLQYALWSELILRICRLTDEQSSRKGSRRQVTIFGLEIAEDPRNKKLAEAKRAAKKAAAFAWAFRDKELAHSDEDVRFGSAKLEGGSRKQLREAIEAISDVIRVYASIEEDVHVILQPVMKGEDETHFLNILRLGLQKQREQRDESLQAMNEGRYNEARALLGRPSWLSPYDEPRS